MSELERSRQALREQMAAQLPLELEFFRRHKAEWLAEHRGQFVLIGKQTFGGFHLTYDAALRAATRMFGLAALFLIEEVC
jgi:hypothetical protein